MENTPVPAAQPKFITDLQVLDTANNFKAFRTWCKAHESMQAAWDACEEPYWMLWLLAAAMWREGNPFGTPPHRAFVKLLSSIEKRTKVNARAFDLVQDYVGGAEAHPLALRGTGSRLAIAAAGETAEIAAAYAAAVSTGADKTAALAMIRAAYPTAPLI